MPNDALATNLHQVKLNYELDGEGNPRLKQPATITVRQGHKILFERGSIPPTSKFTVRFHEPQFFSAATFEEGDAEVTVISDLPHVTTFECGLRGPDHQIIPKSVSGPGAGGDIQPGEPAA